MAEDNRIRYRFTVEPGVNDRVNNLSKKIGVHPQQMAYMCMGLGLTMLEQLAKSMLQAAGNPELIAHLAASQQSKVETAADEIMAGMKKQ